MVRAHPQIPGLVDWRPLARGGFSTVWEARQETLNRLVAVKVDHRVLDEDKEQRRFLREAGAAGRLSGHPGIVTVHDAGILPDDRPYLVMDLCPGGSLTQWLKPENRQSQRRILEVGIRIADALAAAHARGILHRDVKPANILIDSYGQPGLADFGLAALPESGIEPSTTLDGMTPAYAAKEVFYLKPPTEFGDVYSLAATVYALFAGKPPHWPESGTASVSELLELQRHPIERLARVDPRLMDILLGALADDPQARPSAAQFRDQLASVQLASLSELRPKPEAEPVRLTDPAAHALSTGGSAAGSLRSEKPQARRSRPALLIAAALAAAVLVIALVVNLTPDRLVGAPSATDTSAEPTVANPVPTAANPVPTSGTGSTAPTPGGAVPSPSVTTSGPTQPPTIPAGFTDCSASLGGTSYCRSSPECWGGVVGLYDVPMIATPQKCDKLHPYQTFAAGQLPYEPRRQSQLEADEQVRTLCSKATLTRLLRSGKAPKDWEIIALPPQGDSKDDLFRCIFGHGETTKPTRLNAPN